MPNVTYRGAVEATVFAARWGSTSHAMSDLFGQEVADRVKRYNDLWAFYKGDQWRWNREAESPLVTMNLVRRIIDAHVNFLFNAGVTFQTLSDPAKPNTESPEAARVKNYLDNVWRWNRQPLLLFELGQSGGVTGDAFVRVSWNASTRLSPPHPRVEVLSSCFVIPEYGGVDGTDQKLMHRCTVLVPVWVDQEVRGMFGRMRVERVMVLRREVWTAEKRELWENETKLGEWLNPFNEIPIVHIANYPCAGEPFGIDDITAVENLQRAFNEKTTNVSDILDYHAAPTTIVAGAKISQLEKGANRVWSVPKDATVNNLEMGGDLGAMKTYIDGLKDMMLLLSGTPEFALGGGEATDVSGISLAIRYQPMIEIRAVKEEMYGHGLQQVNRLILRCAELNDREFGSMFSKLPANRYWTTIVFGYPLPRDEGRALENAKTRLELRITTRIRELKAMGYSDADAQTIIDEADAEAEKLAQAGMEDGTPAFGGRGNKGNPNPTRPAPESQSEAVSETAGDATKE